MGCYGRFFGAIVVAVVLVMVPTGVSCHGRLMDPPQRSSMWRLGFNVPTNYDDNALFCGGFMVILFLSLNLTAPNVFFNEQNQYNEINQGRCGECGDEWSLTRPRLNDEGGLYGTGTIGKTYIEGQVWNTIDDLQIRSNKRQINFESDDPNVH